MTIIGLLECFIDQIDAGNFVKSLLSDFSKVFNCPDYALHLQKLNNLDINGTCWFLKYLTDRQQVVEIKSNQNGISVTVRS